MSPFRLFLCVDGSPAALQAARLSLELAKRLGGSVLAVAVLENHETTRELGARYADETAARERLEQGMRAVLERLSAMAAERAVAVQTELLEGDPLQAVLKKARGFRPDLVVIGRTGRSGPGSPMTGSLTLQLLEFADWPVVVVPEAIPASTTP